MDDRNLSLALSRVVDRAETRGDWDLIEREARSDPELWRGLASLLRDDCELREALAPQRAKADRVELVPALPAMRGARYWVMGAAAALFVFFAVLWVWPSSSRPLLAEPAELLSQYVKTGKEKGILLEELPNVTLDVRTVPGEEGLEVIFVRRFVERTLVREAWQIGTDEHGQPQPARVDLAACKPGSSF